MNNFEKFGKNENQHRSTFSWNVKIIFDDILSFRLSI